MIMAHYLANIRFATGSINGVFQSVLQLIVTASVVTPAAYYFDFTWGLKMTDKTTNNFAVEWSEEICDWIVEQADEADIEPEVAVYAALAAAVVLARSVDMDDQAIQSRFDVILAEEFPESMMQDSKHWEDFAASPFSVP
jgi:hypothetical protein